MIPVEPIRKSISVPLSTERAFALFTGEIGTWWPLREYSCGQEKSVAVVIEDRVGGRIYEVQNDGSQCVWGTILVWDPPRCFATTWHPGRPASTSQEVEVRFVAEGDDSTRVELEHRGWETLGDRAKDQHQSYDSGWNTVLGRYADGGNRRVFSCDEEICTLVSAFEACTLPLSDFKHSAHIAVGLAYLAEAGLPEATGRMRRSLQRFVNSHGHAEGYHETLTVFWMKLLDHLATAKYAGIPLWQRANAVVKSHGDRWPVLRHYADGTITSAAARHDWTEPDLQSIPF